MICLADDVDAVLSLHNHLSLNFNGVTNSTALSPLITHLAPLILDTSSPVRGALLDSLNDLSPNYVPRESLFPHLSTLLLYIQSAMTHIHSPVRSDSTKFLAWTINIGGEEVVRSAWTKILASYAGLLGWTIKGEEKSRIQLSRGSSILGNVVVTCRHITTLYTFLSAGILQKRETGHRKAKVVKYATGNGIEIQHSLMEAYLLPTHSAPFAYLNLFSSPLVEGQVSSHDVPSRRTQFEGYISSVLSYLYDLTAELVPSEMSRRGDQTQVDELRVSVVRILGLIKMVYREDEEGGKKKWDKEWKRCLAKMNSLMEMKARSVGSRKLFREWELAGLDSA